MRSGRQNIEEYQSCIRKLEVALANLHEGNIVRADDLREEHTTLLRKIVNKEETIAKEKNLCRRLMAAINKDLDNM